jgi:hypothetical protein
MDTLYGLPLCTCQVNPPQQAPLVPKQPGKRELAVYGLRAAVSVGLLAEEPSPGLCWDETTIPAR